MVSRFKICAMVAILIWISSCQFAGNAPTAKLPVQNAATPEPTPETETKKPNQAKPIQKEWTNLFTFKRHSLTEKHDGYCPYELSAEYPEAISARPSVRRFNRWIKRKILADVHRLRGLELRAEPRAKKRGKKLLTEGLELSFHAYFSNARLISLRLTHRVMAAGQMHPINYYETINYDLRKNRPLMSRDVFRRGYLKVFSSYSRKYLTDTYEIFDDSWFHEGTAARHSNFENWNLVPGGVLISFEDYQVSSHSFGQPELIVPYSRLKKLLKAKVDAKLKVVNTTEPSSAAEKAKRPSDFFASGDIWHFMDFTVQRRVRKVKPEGTDSSNSLVDVSYLTVTRGGKLLRQFDADVYFGLGNSAQAGYFPFMKGGPLQMCISQDVPRGGRQWVIRFSPQFRVIFDGQKFGVGREAADLSAIDLDGDGNYEISVPITDFYDLQDKMSIAQIPLPAIIFKYDRAKREYLPANRLFQEYLIKANVFEEVSAADELKHRSVIIGHLLDLIYAGRRTDAWNYFESHYKLNDKAEIERRVRSILRRQPVYNFIYNQRKPK